MSKRQEGKKITGVNQSRPVRRAKERLASAMEVYNVGVKISRDSGKGYTQPGAIKHW